jgi:hypothetical protein
MAGVVDSVGVCDSKKTVGVKLDTNVGIEVNLNAGQIKQAPDFQKELFNTNWPLFSSCIGVGDDNAKPTDMPQSTETEPPVETPMSTVGPIETGVSMPMGTGTGVTGTGMPLITGTGTVSGMPMATGNSTFLRMEQRTPKLLYYVS